MARRCGECKYFDPRGGFCWAFRVFVRKDSLVALLCPAYERGRLLWELEEG